MGQSYKKRLPLKLKLPPVAHVKVPRSHTSHPELAKAITVLAQFRIVGDEGTAMQHGGIRSVQDHGRVRQILATMTCPHLR